MTMEQVNNTRKLIEYNSNTSTELAKELENMIYEDISKFIHDEFEKLKKKG